MINFIPRVLQFNRLNFVNKKQNRKKTRNYSKNYKEK